MRKKMLMLAFALTALAASTSTTARAASGYYSCPQCTTYADGSQCCVPCLCNAQGWIVACTNVICPPAGGHD